MMSSIQKILLEIQETQSFERLESLKDSKLWSQMTSEERELFALLLIQYGSHQLARGENKVLENFEFAAKLTSYSSVLLYQQGLIFASYNENSRCLNLACQAFAKAVNSDPQFFLAYYKWAEVLLNLGILENEQECLVEADHKFKKASQLMQEISDSKFYWNWGLCLYWLGKHSGEPIDFQQAINHYRLANEYGCNQPKFYNDYGCVLVDLAALLERPELLFEALKWFDKAVEYDPKGFENWYNYACCLSKLSEISLQEEYFEYASESFLKASEINPASALLWLKWGQLESHLGKIKYSQALLESSLEKFSKAQQLDPDLSIVFSCCGEVELFLGSYEERLDLLQSAKVKILKSIELQPENPDIWYLYGSCLNELGHYFEEESFYHQAIEKFEYGLSIDNRHPLLWYGLGLSHFALGEMTEDGLMFEKAARYCASVIEVGGGALAQFWNDWGVALLKLAEMTRQPEHIEAAIEKFERALKLPALGIEYEDVDLEWVYNYGCALDLLGDITEDPRHFERSIRILSHIVQIDPNYAHARYNLALTLSHLGELTFDVELYQKAMEHFQILLDNDPEEEAIHLDYGINLISFALLVQDVHHLERSQMLFKQSELHLIQSASLGNCQAYYQLAGLYSLTNHYALAMYYIERSRTYGVLPPVEDMLHDEWLEGLRDTPSFRQFISQLSGQSNEEK